MMLNPPPPLMPGLLSSVSNGQLTGSPGQLTGLPGQLTGPSPLLTGARSPNSTKFCLKWNNFGRNVTTTFRSLLENEEFVDVSLSAQGNTIKAHKVVLSASSQYFRDLLQDINSWQHPVIVLRDVPFSDLQGLVEFIYHGEVSVDQEDLASFLKTAQTLRVKGLTEENACANSAKGSSHPTVDSKDLPVNVEEEIDDDEEGEEEEEEIVFNNPDKTGKPQSPIQRGSSAPPPNSNHHHHSRKSPHPKRAINPIRNSLQEPVPNANERETDEESEPGIFAGEIDDREEEEIAQQQQVAAVMAAANSMLHHFMSSPSPSSLLQKQKNKNHDEQDEDENGGGDMVIDEDPRLPLDLNSPLLQPSQSGKSAPNSTGKKTCPYCFQQLSWHALSRHIRDMHRNKSGFVNCKFCGKVFRNKNSLGCHMWRFHKDQRGAGAEPNEAKAKEEVMVEADV